MNRNNLYPVLLTFLSVAFLFNSCQKDEKDNEYAEENKAFYGLMEEWYYWYEDMPAVKPEDYPSPYELLEALRYKPLDRWSYISSREEFVAYYQESKFIGYGFGSGWGIIPESHPAYDPGSGQEWKLWVSFIFNTVEMYDKGVRRGWIIDEINGVKVNERTNINQVLGPNETGVSNTFLFIDPDGTEVKMTLSKQEVFMNTVLHREIIETGSKKAGYLVFKNFTRPSFTELAMAIDYFNSEGIDELILDLRYNGGGQTDVANYLASVIGGPALADQPFAKYIYNNKKEADQNFTDNFSSEDRNLALDRLITITTKATASASEMVINGLIPFMPVYIIGDDTYGKPMGMNVWFYEAKYAFVPVTFKTVNADGEGDYFDGLPAQSYVEDDLSFSFGDPEEPLLKEALFFIETESFSMRTRKKSVLVQPYERMTGLRAEIGAH